MSTSPDASTLPSAGPRRVLVLGAGGYVGRRVVRALQASGWARPVPALRRAAPVGTEPSATVLDATDSAAVTAALREVDGVVNCVAGAAASMVAGARALRQALGAVGRPVAVVHFSSMAVYGPATGLIDETAPLRGEGDYGEGKVATERELAGLPGVVTLRPGCIYGPGSPQWSVRIERLLRARRIGDLGESGDGCSNLVYIDDVVQAVLAGLRLAPDATPAVFNLAMPGAPTWNDYFIAYARALGAVPVARIGRRRLTLETKLLAPWLKLAEIGLRGRGPALPPPIPPSLLRLWQQDIRLDAQAATRQLGIAWTPLAQGLASTLPTSQDTSPCN